MILLTGAAGFIGSCALSDLNARGHGNVILVDEFPGGRKEANLIGKSYAERWHRKDLELHLRYQGERISHVLHLGARTDTAEKDESLFAELNLRYSKLLWNFCAEREIPFVYASSAATYGNGQWGFEDDHSLLHKLRPLNPYAFSKHEFDLWALKQEDQPAHWAGLKFFNVYGPNEYHKDRMSSVIRKAYYQILETGKVKLFRSHNERYVDGEQYRDFVYVKDVSEVCMYFLFDSVDAGGLYNVGSGKARTFLDLAKATFAAMEREVNIEFIDIPEDIRAHYQYYTEAPITKLKASGFQREMTSLELGIEDYVRSYLRKNRFI